MKMDVVDAKEPRAVSPSPIPRALSIILIVLAAITLGQAVFFQAQRSADVHAQDVKYKTITDELAHRQDIADRDRNRIAEDEARLEALVQALAFAKTPTEVQAALSLFLEQQRQAESDRRAQDSSPSPHPSPQASPTPGGTSPSPTQSPRPTPTRSATPTPSPTPTAVCVYKPVVVCF